MNSILFTDNEGEPATLALQGFVYAGFFYGIVETSRGARQVVIALKTYIRLLNE